VAEKVIGVLGGLGPWATLDLFEKILRLTPARRDQDHLRVIIDSNAKIPDRGPAILGEGEDPTPALVATARNLERAGAEVLVIPCNTAHAFYDAVAASVRIPVLHIMEEVAAALRAGRPEVRRAGVLATRATVAARLYHRACAAVGVEVLTPDDPGQEAVTRAIYAVKAGAAGAAERAAVAAVARGLVERGAGAVILGCTELPLVLRPDDAAVTLIDSTLVLAQAAIRAARAVDEPVALHSVGGDLRPPPTPTPAHPRGVDLPSAGGSSTLPSVQTAAGPRTGAVGPGWRRGMAPKTAKNARASGLRRTTRPSAARGRKSSPTRKPSSKTTPKLRAVAPVADRTAPRGKPARPLTKRELAEFRRLLEDEKRRLMDELEAMEEHTPEIEDQVGMDIGGGYDEDLADVASSTFEREKGLALESSVQQMLAQVEEALVRMEEGTYGICQRCGNPIDVARLRVLPFATLDIRCKELEEKANGLLR